MKSRLIRGVALAATLVAGGCAGTRGGGSWLDAEPPDRAVPVGDGQARLDQRPVADQAARDGTTPGDAAPPPADLGGCPAAAALVGQYNGNFEGQVTWEETLLDGGVTFAISGGADPLAIAGQLSGQGGNYAVSAKIQGTVSCGKVSAALVDGKVHTYSFSGQFAGALDPAGFFLGTWNGQALGYSGAGTWKAYKQ